MKKTFKLISKTILILSAVSLLNACKIDVVPTDRYSDEVIWSDEASIELYVNGLYQEFRRFQFGTFPIGYDNATDALTDIMKYTSTSAGNGTVNILASNASRVSAASPSLNYWNNGYTRIRRINEFLHGLNTQETSLDEAEKARYEAEARFVRGYVYFWLTRINGSVIIMDELEDHTRKDMPRSSEEECWNFAAEDFRFASTHLPKQWDNPMAGKATQGAALGMLARTWLYAASTAEFDKKQFNQDPLTGIPAGKAAEYYQHAADAAQAVVDLADEGYYGLDDNFSSIFTDKSTPESIFRIDFVTQQLTHLYDLGFAPPGDAPGHAIVYGVPTAELVDEFEMDNGQEFRWSDPVMAANPYENREARFYATILYNGASWKGRTLNTTPSGGDDGFVPYASSVNPGRTVTGYYARKMLDPDNTDFVINRSTQSWHELRYAEVLLILAEAKAMLNDLAGARQALNTLRNKRELPDTPANSKDGMMAAIEHERIVELAFEGHRYWDLRRWRKAHLVLNDTRFTGHKITPVGDGYSYEVVSADNMDREFSPAMYYMPIVESEVQRNNELNQIQGW